MKSSWTTKSWSARIANIPGREDLTVWRQNMKFHSISNENWSRLHCLHVELPTSWMLGRGGNSPFWTRGLLKRKLFKLSVHLVCYSACPCRQTPNAKIFMWKKNKTASTLQAHKYQELWILCKKEKNGYNHCFWNVSGSNETVGHIMISQQVVGSDELKWNVPAERLWAPGFNPQRNSSKIQH